MLEDGLVVAGKLLEAVSVLGNGAVGLAVLGDVAHESRFNFGGGGSSADKGEGKEGLHLFVLVY